MQWNKQRISVVGAMVLVLAAAWWIWAGDREARQIKRQFDRLVEVLEKREEIPPLRMMTRARRAAEFFTADVQLKLSPIVERTLLADDISPVHHLVHTQVAQLTLRITDQQLAIADDRQSATMRFTVRSRVRTHHGAQETRIDEFRLQWVKQDGNWLIQTAEIVPAIRPPRPVHLSTHGAII